MQTNFTEKREKRKLQEKKLQDPLLLCCNSLAFSKVGCINIDLAGMCPTFICTDIINVLKNEKSILFSCTVNMYSQECAQIMQITAFRLAI